MLHARSLPRLKNAEVRDDADFNGANCGFSMARSKNWGMEIAVAALTPAHD
jgi:hypothetical protein